MSKMVVFLLLSFLFLLGFSDAGQETIEPLNIVDPIPMILRSLSHTDVAVAVSVRESDLHEVSSSVLMAESWVRTHVLTYFPSTKITTIVVGNGVLCSKDHEEKWDLVLPSLKNIHHSLVRWGLEKEIKVSASFSGDCLKQHPNSFRDDLTARVISPLLSFFRNSNSTYCVSPPLDFSPLSSEAINLVSAHYESIKRLGMLGPLQMSGTNVLLCIHEKQRPKSRKLSFMSSNVVEPYPARPTPLPPIRSSIGLSAPAHVAKNPLPPLSGIASPPSFSHSPAPQPSFTHTPAPPPSFTHTPAPPPSMSFSFSPEGSPLVIPSNPPDAPTSPTPSFTHISAPTPSMSFSFSPEGSPVVIPSNPPDALTLPPCSAVGIGAPAPKTGEEKGLWCVAKPSVPADTLQEAMDYACGEGGADCEEIEPQGSCYYPDTVVAHASYAFNSYWQKNKGNGGSCNFGGTAMIINADPSFLHCRFILS